MVDSIKCVGNFVSFKKMEDGVLTAVASNASIDRDGEIIEPKAFKKHLKYYRSNPVILSSHTHRTDDGSPPIIGSTKRIELTDEALEFDMTFASHPNAQYWRGVYEEGHAKAFSVGFMPMKGEKKIQEDGREVYTHTEVELYEISAVAVGSNREALSRDISPDVISLLEKYLQKHDERDAQSIKQLGEAQAKTLAALQEYMESLLIQQNPLYDRIFNDADDQDDADAEQLDQLKTQLRSIK